MATITALFLSIILFFSGCSNSQPQIPVTIQQKCPKLRTLRRINTNIPPLELKTVKKATNGNIVVSEKELVEAVKTSGKLRRAVSMQKKQIDFYVYQITRYNKLYVKEDKE